METLLVLFCLQALSSFSAALQSGQLGPLMSQFDLGEDVANAAAEGGQSFFNDPLLKRIQ